MKALLIGSIVCLTAGSFYGAERLTSSKANAASLEQKAITQKALDAQLKQSQAGFAQEIALLKEVTSAAAIQIETLTDTVKALTTERDDLAMSIAVAQDEAKTSQERLAEAERNTSDARFMHADLVEKVSLQQAAIAEKDLELDDLRARVDNLLAKISSPVHEASENDQLAAEVATLSEALKTRDEMIASMEAKQVEAMEAAQAAQQETATAEIDEAGAATREELAVAKDRIDEMTATAAEQSEAANAQIGKLSAVLSERDATIATLEAELGATKVAPETGDDPGASQQLAQIEVLGEQVSELTQIVADQTVVIANLRLGFGETPVSAMELAEACVTRANGILEGSQIQFGVGTTAISGDSVATLDSLRDLAIGCKNDELVIEIGGHTDSFGAEADNQALSEARATSVKDFLVGRGIPAENMVAVGFGETQPISTNDTKAGRAENRRITFTWKVRETLSDTAEG